MRLVAVSAGGGTGQRQVLLLYGILGSCVEIAKDDDPTRTIRALFEPSSRT